MFAIASGRYEWIGRMIRAAVTHPRPRQISLTDRIDRWATHPFWGLFILAGILGLVFWLTFTIGARCRTGWTQRSSPPGQLWPRAAWQERPPGCSGLLVDGVIGGVGSVLTFLPILVIFFASFGLARGCRLHGPRRLCHG